MKHQLKKVVNYLKVLFGDEREYFEENGERIFIDYENIEIDRMDFYQINHYKRYEYALKRITSSDRVGDFACGSGYGSLLIASKANHVVAVDIDKKIIQALREKYTNYKNIQFIDENLLNLDYAASFSKLISFETIEHVEEESAIRLFMVFHKALIQSGELIFSVPYMQKKSKVALEMGHHKIFDIDEIKIQKWLDLSGFQIKEILYQNYQTHEIKENIENKEFLICVAKKKAA